MGEQIKAYVGGMSELMKEWNVNSLNAKDTKMLHAKLTDLYKHVRIEHSCVYIYIATILPDSYVELQQWLATFTLELELSLCLRLCLFLQLSLTSYIYIATILPDSYAGTGGLLTVVMLVFLIVSKSPCSGAVILTSFMFECSYSRYMFLVGIAVWRNIGWSSAPLYKCCNALNPWHGAW